MVVERLKMEHVPQTVALQKQLIDFELSDEDAKERYGVMLKNPDCFVAVAREKDEILGTATGLCCRALSMPFLVIEDVVVKPECRGMGIGGRLMAALDDFARMCRCEYAILVSSGYRKQAHRFYEKQGFEEDVRGFRKGYACEK